MVDVDYKKSSFKENIIHNLKEIDLPQKLEYKGNNYPFHMVNAVVYKNNFYSEFIKRDMGAAGVVNYYPADLRSDGVYDLLTGKMLQGLSRILESESDKLRIVTNHIDKWLIINHCPEKAEGKYFLMPETLAVYTDKATSEAFYRLIPIIIEPYHILPDNSIEHMMMYHKLLEISARMFMNDSSIKSYSLTPDISSLDSKLVAPRDEFVERGLITGELVMVRDPDYSICESCGTEFGNNDLLKHCSGCGFDVPQVPRKKNI